MSETSNLSVNELEAIKEAVEQELEYKRDNPDFDADANILELLKRRDFYRKVGWDGPREVVVKESATLMDLPEEKEVEG